MRYARMSVLLLCILLPLNSGFGEAAGVQDLTITGRLITEHGEFSCDRCVITLLMSNIRVVATTFADLSGRFAFQNVPRGSYAIHAEIEGFETVNYSVNTLDGFAAENNVTILLTRKPVLLRPPSGNIVDISEFSQRYPKKAVEFFHKGVDRRKKNDYRQATKLFEEAVRVAPDFYHAHNELGLAYKETGRLREAEQHFLRAHELNRSNADPLVNLTSLYIEENQPDRAVETGEEAVKKNSRSAPAFFNLGMALYKISKLDRAEAALKKALELAPKMANVRLMLANVYLKLRNRDKVLEQLDSYLAEHPNGEQRQVVQEMRSKLVTPQLEEMP